MGFLCLISNKEDNITITYPAILMSYIFTKLYIIYSLYWFRNQTNPIAFLFSFLFFLPVSETNGSFGNDDNWCMMERPLLVYQSTSVMSCALYCASQPIKCSAFCVNINEEGFQCQIYGKDFDIDDRITALRNRQSSGLSLLYIT